MLPHTHSAACVTTSAFLSLSPHHTLLNYCSNSLYLSLPPPSLILPLLPIHTPFLFTHLRTQLGVLVYDAPIDNWIRISRSNLIPGSSSWLSRITPLSSRLRSPPLPDQPERFAVFVPFIRSCRQRLASCLPVSTGSSAINSRCQSSEIQREGPCGRHTYATHYRLSHLFRHSSSRLGYPTGNRGP